MSKILLVILLWVNGDYQVGVLPFSNMKDCEQKLEELDVKAADAAIDHSMYCTIVSRGPKKRV